MRVLPSDASTVLTSVTITHFVRSACNCVLCCVLVCVTCGCFTNSVPLYLFSSAGRCPSLGVLSLFRLLHASYCLLIMWVLVLQCHRPLCCHVFFHWSSATCCLVSPRESFTYSLQHSNIDLMSFKNSPLFLQAAFFVLNPPCIELRALTFLLSFNP